MRDGVGGSARSEQRFAQHEPGIALLRVCRNHHRKGIGCFIELAEFQLAGAEKQPRGQEIRLQLQGRGRVRDGLRILLGFVLGDA